MTDTLTAAGYLARRLRSLGADHLFGVPGDFNLALLDSMLADGGLTWIGSPNELNAGYAADAYARVRGVSAVVTTFGVGELSLINAIAGAYAEHVPVVQITGAPPTPVAARGALTHHTLADGAFDRFTRAFAEVTAAGAVLTAADAADQIDAVLATALRELRPVYLSVPVDVATAPIPASRLAAPLPVPTATAAALDEFRGRARSLLSGACSAVLVAGHLVERTRTQAAVTRLAEASGSPVVTLASARAAFDCDHPLFAGVYCGDIGAKPAILAVDTADVIIEIGAVLSDTVTGLFTHRDDPARTIRLGATAATVAGTIVDDLPLAAALDCLVDLVDPALGRDVPREQCVAVADGATGPAPLDQASFWSRLRDWLPAGCRVVTDIGTPFFGTIGITVPSGVEVVAQPTWSSIGYALPATLGVALADPARRPVLVIGDGAAQMTVQDLSTLARYGAAPVVIILDNAGYAIERALRDPHACYHDVPAWDWCALARAFAPGAEVTTARAETVAQLDEALAAAAADPDRMAVLQVRLPALDLPPALAAMTDAYRKDSLRGHHRVAGQPSSAAPKETEKRLHQMTTLR